MRARSALIYTVLRLLAFFVPFGVLMLFPVFQELPWLAGIFAALIGLSLSLLFLRRPLEQVTTSFTERRAQRGALSEDDQVEDAANDAVRARPAIGDDGDSAASDSR